MPSIISMLFLSHFLSSFLLLPSYTKLGCVTVLQVSYTLQSFKKKKITATSLFKISELSYVVWHLIA